MTLEKGPLEPKKETSTDPVKEKSILTEDEGVFVPELTKTQQLTQEIRYAESWEEVIEIIKEQDKIEAKDGSQIPANDALEYIEDRYYNVFKKDMMVALAEQARKETIRESIERNKMDESLFNWEVGDKFRSTLPNRGIDTEFTFLGFEDDNRYKGGRYALLEFANPDKSKFGEKDIVTEKVSLYKLYKLMPYMEFLNQETEEESETKPENENPAPQKTGGFWSGLKNLGNRFKNRFWK